MPHSFDHPDKRRSGWQGYLEWKALRSHTIMAWCGVAIFPCFGLLDYLIIQPWELFLVVRFTCSSALALFMIFAKRLGAGSVTVAHVSCHLIMVPLMWMLSQVETTEQFFIYSLNISTAYIASAIFLLWPFRNSVFIVISTATAFVAMCSAFSILSFGEIVASGTLPLMTLIIMSQLFVRYRFKSTYHDFIIQAELNEANLQLLHKNHEIQEQHKEIVLQKEKLEDLNALKDRLLMIISHDFRSPLQSLKGLIFLINDSDRITPEEFRTMVKGLKHTVDKTYDFLEGLLFWSKSQMKGFNVKLQALSLRSLAEDCINLLQSFASKKQISIINEVAKDHIGIGDEDMIRLVIRNLTANAIKFTPTGGVIQIRSYEIDNQIRISVTDNGIGMDEAELDRLFNSSDGFNRLGTAMEKGTGLGLMLCRDFVEKNGGKLSVQSSIGRGTTISFTLLVSVADAAGFEESKATDKNTVSE